MSTDKRIVFGMDTKDTLATVFFFFGFSSTYLDVDLDLCFLLRVLEPGTVETLLSRSPFKGEFFLEDSLTNVAENRSMRMKEIRAPRKRNETARTYILAR